jgi:hypothetical protein
MGVFIISLCPKNKPFYAETSHAEKPWRSHQSHSISKIIGEHICEGRAKAAALPPKHELGSQGLKTGVKFLLCFIR